MLLLNLLAKSVQRGAIVDRVSTCRSSADRSTALYPFLNPLYSGVPAFTLLTVGLKKAGIRGSLYPFSTLSMAALIRNSFQASP